MKRTILAKKTQSGESIAILEDDILVEYQHQKSGEIIPGTIIAGVVKEYQSSLDAYFIDIGSNQNGFLPGKYSNIKYKAGTQLNFQVVRPSSGDKGILLSSKISVSGKFCVINGEDNTIRISSRINSSIERERLLGIAKENLTDNIGIIVRTSAYGAGIDDLTTDFKSAKNIYKRIFSTHGEIGSVIYEPDSIIGEAMRHFNNENDVAYFNDMNLFEKYFSIFTAPGRPATIKYYDKDYEMFAFFGISTKIKEAMNRKVWLKSGGNLVIDYTEAMCVIDVNSSKNTGQQSFTGTAIKTNMEAAKEIAVQIRLRNIGGIIIIDFIDMDEKAKEELDIEFRGYLSKDNKKMTIGGFTSLGNYEITRIRKGKRLEIYDEQ